MADEQIIIQYIVQVEQAVKEIERVRQVIDESKLSIKDLASRTGVSFTEAANQIVRSLKSIDISGIEDIGKFLKLDPTAIANIEATEQNLSKMRTEAIGHVRMANQELAKDMVTQANQEKQLVQESVKWKETLAETTRQQAQAEVQATQERMKVAQQYNQIIRQQASNKNTEAGILFPTEQVRNYADTVGRVLQDAMREATISGEQLSTVLVGQKVPIEQMQSAYILYGKIVDETVAKIVAKSKETGQSFQQVAEQLKQVSPESMSVAIDTAMQKLIASGKVAAQQAAEQKQSQKEQEAAVKAREKAEADLVKQEVAWQKQLAEAQKQNEREIQQNAKERERAEADLAKKELDWKKLLADTERQRQQEAIKLAQQYNQIIRQQTATNFNPQFNTTELRAYADSISKIVNSAMAEASASGTTFSAAIQKQTTDVQQLNSAYLLYGKTVDTVTQTIIVRSKETGLSYQQVAEQLKQMSPPDMGVAIDAAMQRLADSGKVVTQQLAQQKQAQREYEQATAKGYQNMSVAAQQFGQQVQAVKQQIIAQSQATGQPFNVVAQQMQQAGTSAAVLNTAMKQLNQTGQQTNTTMGQMGQTLMQAFAVGLGMNLYNAVQQIISLFKEAAVSGFELAKAMFQLEVGIRAVRRAGVDITTPEMFQNLDKLSEKFGVFSKKSLVEGSAALINLIRDMGMTKEQIFSLQDSIATLAVVNGRSMEEVQRTVALALSSGYTEGLQRLGVSINRVNIAARANAMGWSGGYMNLTEHQRALATLSLIMEKTAKYSNDLTRYLETEAGQIDATTAKIEDMKAALGDNLLPVQLLASKGMLEFISNLNDLVVTASPIIKIIANLITVFSDFNDMMNGEGEWVKKWPEWLRENIKVLKMFWDIVTAGPGKAIVYTFDKFTESLQKLYLMISKYKDLGWFGDMLEKIFDIKQPVFPETIPLGTPELNTDNVEESGKQLKDYVSGLHDDIEKENRNFQNRMESLERDFIRDMEKIDRELTRDLEAIDRENQQKRADIILNGHRKEVDAIKDYNQKLVDLERDYQNKIRDENIKYAEEQAQAGRKYRDNEIQAELDYQEKLRQMRESFLLDLQGALQERDAKQVLNLIRRYNLDKDQAARDFKNGQDERRRQFEQENEERARQHQLRLEEMAREKEDRLRALAEEQAQKIAQIREDTQLQLEEQQRRYEQEKEDRNRKAEEDRAEREIQRKQQIEELKIDSANRLKEIVAALANEKGMTAAMLQEIGLEYRKMYGPNGVIEGQIRYYIQMLQVAAKARAQLSSMFGGSTGFSANENVAGAMTGNGGAGGSKPYSGLAEGGIMYADRPTTVMFGEGGLEKAEFTPLNHAGKDTGRVVGANLESAPSMNGTIALRVLLSPDLIAEIQENTLEQTANILFEVQRRS